MVYGPILSLKNWSGCKSLFNRFFGLQYVFNGFHKGCTSSLRSRDPLLRRQGKHSTNVCIAIMRNVSHLGPKQQTQGKT